MEGGMDRLEPKVLQLVEEWTTMNICWIDELINRKLMHSMLKNYNKKPNPHYSKID